MVVKIKYKLLILSIFLISLIFISGCEIFDTSKAEIKLKHTLKLPAGFSIESSVPLDMDELTKGTKNPKKFYETDQFSVVVEITNKNKKYTDTKIQLEYNQNNFEYLYAYYSDGQPLDYLGNGIYEFDKDALPDAVAILHIIGKTKRIPDYYSYVGMNFKLDFLENSGEELATFNYGIRIDKQDFVIIGNVLDENKSDELMVI